MSSFEDLEVEIRMTELGPQVRLEGKSWNSKKIRTLKKLIDQAYNRWRKEQYKLSKREESEDNGSSRDQSTRTKQSAEQSSSTGE